MLVFPKLKCSVVFENLEVGFYERQSFHGSKASSVFYGVSRALRMDALMPTSCVTPMAYMGVVVVLHEAITPLVIASSPSLP